MVYGMYGTNMSYYPNYMEPLGDVHHEETRRPAEIKDYSNREKDDTQIKRGALTIAAALVAAPIVSFILKRKFR